MLEALPCLKCCDAEEAIRSDRWTDVSPCRVPGITSMGWVSTWMGRQGSGDRPTCTSTSLTCSGSGCHTTTGCCGWTWTRLSWIWRAPWSASLTRSGDRLVVRIQRLAMDGWERRVVRSLSPQAVHASSTYSHECAGDRCTLINIPDRLREV